MSSDEEGLSCPIRQIILVFLYLEEVYEKNRGHEWSLVRPVDSPLISDGREGAAFSRGEVLIVSH